MLLAVHGTNAFEFYPCTGGVLSSTSHGLDAVGARSTLGWDEAGMVWVIRRLLGHGAPPQNLGSLISRVVSVRNVPRARNIIPELSRLHQESQRRVTLCHGAFWTGTMSRPARSFNERMTVDTDIYVKYARFD